MNFRKELSTLSPGFGEMKEKTGETESPERREALQYFCSVEQLKSD